MLVFFGDLGKKDFFKLISKKCYVSRNLDICGFIDKELQGGIQKFY